MANITGQLLRVFKRDCNPNYCGFLLLLLPLLLPSGHVVKTPFIVVNAQLLPSGIPRAAQTFYARYH